MSQRSNRLALMPPTFPVAILDVPRLRNVLLLALVLVLLITKGGAG